MLYIHMCVYICNMQFSIYFAGEVSHPVAGAASKETIEMQR